MERESSTPLQSDSPTARSPVRDVEIRQMSQVPTVSEYTLFDARWAAYLHNCVRFNKLSLLKLIDKKLHDEVTKSSECKVKFQLAICLILMIFIPWGYALVTKYGSQQNRVYDEWFATKYGFGLGCLSILSTVLASYFIQLGLGTYADTFVNKSSGCLEMSPESYTFIFRLYYYVYKIWQTNVILPYAPGLTYCNYCLWPIPRLQHTGIFVVGGAVNAVQANLIAYGLAALESKNPAFLTVVCYAITRIILKVMEYLMSPSANVLALIDAAIQAHECGPLLLDMSKRSSFAVTVDQLEALKKLSGADTACRVLPGQTHTRSILYQRQAGEWKYLNLSDGTLSQL